MLQKPLLVTAILLALPLLRTAAYASTQQCLPSRPPVASMEPREARMMVATCTDTNSDLSEVRHRQFVSSPDEPYRLFARRRYGDMQVQDVAHMALWSCVVRTVVFNGSIR